MLNDIPPLFRKLEWDFAKNCYVDQDGMLYRRIEDDNASAGQPVGFISTYCENEQCSLCGEPAARKVGEDISHDDPNSYRHNLTAYVCKAHFDQIMDKDGFTNPSQERIRKFDKACDALEEKYRLTDENASSQFHDVGALRGYCWQLLGRIWPFLPERKYNDVGYLLSKLSNAETRQPGDIPYLGYDSFTPEQKMAYRVGYDRGTSDTKEDHDRPSERDVIKCVNCGKTEERLRDFVKNWIAYLRALPGRFPDSNLDARTLNAVNKVFLSMALDMENGVAEIGNEVSDAG